MQNNSISVMLVGAAQSPCSAHLESLFARRGKGFDVEVIQRPERAYARIEKTPVDVIIIQQAMDDALLKFIEAVSAHHHHPAVVVIAEGVDEKQLHNAMRAGAQDFLDRQEIGNGTLPRVVIHAAQRREAQQTRVLKKAGVPADVMSRVGLDRLLALDEEIQSEDFPDGET
ncbi:hypothetical protein LCGC14_0583730 [marine sediment metagenome]|uniref:Response regulatory domain-containing protein n=1 Tax=marine sediment metagenome TaxID=412755 RepID=A0A0F9RZB8_9ZZZZ